MAKAMTIFGMAVAGLLLLVFGADLFTGIIFGSAANETKMMHIGVIVASISLLYMSFSTFREQK
ncbi:MAG: hypothetical protein AAGA92_02635 [Planctomycetota bacterium]